MFRKPDFLLLFIILVAVVLRFYGFPNIPFMYDEVSAWARTGFSSFHELMEHGVKGDGHPAGIQVFLYYWRMIAGDSEAAFKFPFLVMGVLSIWMIFRIGKFWFTNTVGYLASAFMATLQYTVMYSQIARPYVSGLFFSLMMVWCWTNYFFNATEKRKRLQLIGFVVFGALCCYDHYFSMLFAGMVGITGLFFLNRENWKGYLLAGVIIVLLFLPHFPTTIYQFGIGGVGGWLAKPTPQFVSDYFHYLFHFSAAVKWMVILLVVLSIFLYNKDIRSQQKFRIIALAWFVFPFLIGYYYSVYRNAVLQFSVLIFSFPYLLLFAFSLYRELKTLYNAVLVSVVMFACIYTLVFKREYYHLFYRQPVEQLVKNSVQSANQLKSKKCTVLINEPRKYVGYYLEKYHSDLPMDFWAEKNFQTYIEFRKYLSALSSDCFIAGNIPGDYLMLVKEFYPFKIKREVGFTYNFKCFSKS
ncbi:MAG TPA: glycosyltransferase family 39 protein, partial [Puia sp.]|nr:glycosyltransferase family 39 protein [Puia sp.]